MGDIRSVATLDAGDLQIGASFVVLALLALAVSRHERRHVLQLFGLYLASLILHFASAEVGAAGLPGAAAVGHLVATLRAPTFFGEMGLLLGEPRHATVVAREDVECWRVTKEAFQEILTARPSLAAEISRILAQREVELAAVREGLSDEARRARLEAEQHMLLSKIRGFFGIG